ncbi:uncharacterized protein PV06_11248 [Exophiala oligosperma]|uniref:Uncharacterized protein n=1 Tax=Exophiala oligosperma TaxID=215243 RepID=A0A0D2DLI2_9EURO|nr:uncharacterized protein PV06_11248 [Exophiala oligosperma]KIW36539.1 hypothetical protein PV06_11248 [Exophiala oligosperma]
MNERAHQSLPGPIAEDPWEVTVGLKQEQHALRRVQHDLENVDPREITDIHDKPRVWTQHQGDRTSLAVLPSNVKYPRQACKLHSRCKATIQDKRYDPREHHTLLFTLFKVCHSRRPRFRPTAFESTQASANGPSGSPTAKVTTYPRQPIEAKQIFPRRSTKTAGIKSTSAGCTTLYPMAVIAERSAIP